MLVSEKLYIVSGRSVLERGINEHLICFSCWINGNINAEYLPPFTPSPPRCAHQIQRRLTVSREHACYGNGISHWNKGIPLAQSEMCMDKALGARIVALHTSAMSVLSFVVPFVRWLLLWSVSSKERKALPPLCTALLWSEDTGLCLTQQLEGRASHTLLFRWHCGAPCVRLCHHHTCCCKAIDRAAAFLCG